MFDLAASGGPESLGYCPCNGTDPAGLLSMFLGAAGMSIFLIIIFHFNKERRGTGNTGAKGDLKEQADRQGHVGSTARTPSAAAELWAGRGAAFPARSSRSWPSHAAFAPSLTQNGTHPKLGSFHGKQRLCAKPSRRRKSVRRLLPFSLQNQPDQPTFKLHIQGCSA